MELRQEKLSPQTIEMIGRDVEKPSQMEFRNMDYQLKKGDSLEYVIIRV